MKTKKIEILGQEVLIGERSAQDVLEIVEFIQQQEENNKQDLGAQIFAAAQSLSSALKVNIDNIPRWQIWKRWQLKRRYSATSLILKLSPREMFEYQNTIQELEGVSKKKASENQLAEAQPQA